MPLFGNLQTAQAILARAVAICSALRQGMHDAADFESWLAGAADADLLAAPPDGPGLSQPTIDMLRSAFADLEDLVIKVNGGPGDGNHPTPYDYTQNTKKIIGPG
jgi:hypothetical protein